MSTEWYLFDEQNNDAINLRDILKPEIYHEFIVDFVHKNYQYRTNLTFVIDDALDTFKKYPNKIKIGGGK